MTPGARLGPYEIVAPLGAGGMGEVYRARDARLDREVAIKVLPASVAGDADQLARFGRETKAIAALSHPNILVIFDVGVHAVTGTTDTPVAYAVTELLEGETLRARLSAAPQGLPPRKAVDIAVQVARGLAAAHEKGIVHRDLKPENIFLVRDGQVKILDFGLAKSAVDGTLPESGETRTAFATSPGMLLGTLGYMAPEQVRGLEVDARADLFALGAVLYELLGGRRAFQGATTADTMTAILKEDPPQLAGSRAELPPALERIVRHCLEKNPVERFHSARDVAFALEALSGPRRAEGGPLDVSPPGRTWLRAAGVAGLVAVTAVAGWWFGRGGRPPAGAEWSQYTQLTDAAGVESAPVIAPDGNSFAYVRRVGASLDIFVQRIGGRNPTPVAADSTRDENWPAFSPDGARIAFNESDNDGGIFVTGATGESERRVTDFGFNPAWSPDGRRLAFVNQETSSPDNVVPGRSLWVVTVDGGAPVKLLDGEVMQPAWSPSGDRIAVWSTDGGQRDLATVSVDSGERVPVLSDVPTDWAPRWAPDGHHLYFSSDRGGSMGLWRQRINEASGQAIGMPELVAGGVEATLGLPSLSGDGRRMLFRAETKSVNPIRIPFDPVTGRAGSPVELLSQSGLLAASSVSPDGLWIALMNAGAVQEDILLVRSDGTGLRRLTDDPARDRWPRFSHDSNVVTFYSNRSGGYQAYSIRIDGSALTRLSDLGNDVAHPSFSPDGRMLLASSGSSFVLARPPWPFTRSSATIRPFPPMPGLGALMPVSWSPDGQRIAGTILNGGNVVGVGVYDVGTGEARALSEDHGVLNPQFLPDGQRVVYVLPGSGLVLLDVVTGARRLLPVDLRRPPFAPSVAVSPDGRAIYYSALQMEANIWMVERRR